MYQIQDLGQKVVGDLCPFCSLAEGSRKVQNQKGGKVGTVVGILVTLFLGLGHLRWGFGAAGAVQFS